jgi:transposase
MRELTVELVESGALSEAEAADHAGISVASIQKWRRRKRETGSLVDLPRRNGPVRVLAALETRLRTLIATQPDLGLAELCERVEQETGVKSNPSMMCRELQRLKLRLKKSRSMTASAIRPGFRKPAPFSPRSKKRT